jgi:hypothetical protein
MQPHFRKSNTHCLRGGVRGRDRSVNAYPLSDRIQPVQIDRKAKWAYMGKFGFPETRMTNKSNFDKLIAEINASANEQNH